MATVEMKSRFKRGFDWCLSNTHRIEGLEEAGPFLREGDGLIVDFDGVFTLCNRDFYGNFRNLLQLRRLVEPVSWVTGVTGRWMVNEDEGKDKERKKDRISNFPFISRGDLARLETLLGSRRHQVTFQTGMEKYLGNNNVLSDQVNNTLGKGCGVLFIGSGLGDWPLALELVRRSGNLSDGFHFACTGCWF